MPITDIPNKGVYWINSTTGQILDGYDDINFLDNGFSLLRPVKDTNTIFYASSSGYYLFDVSSKEHQQILLDFEFDGLVRDWLHAPFSFSGEENCNQSDN